MKFKIALIGRRNVGKSVLFNRITKTRDALTDKFPGLTRDRQYGYLENNKQNICIIDTAGFINSNKNTLDKKIFDQTLQAIQESHLILFIVDCCNGIMSEDLQIAKMLRIYQKKIIVLTNKIDAVKIEYANLEFYNLGFKDVHAISALYGNGIDALFKKYIYRMIEFNLPKHSYIEKKYSYMENGNAIKIAFVGKPNVGKSTLINSYIKSERLITHSIPGTTRDSIWVPCQDYKKNFIFIDTAGLKKINNINHVHHIEQISKNKTIQNVKYANIVIIVIDATQNISNRDLSLFDFIMTLGKAIIIVMNKCDLLTKKEINVLQEKVKFRLRFAKFITVHFVSAKCKIGINSVIRNIDKIYRSSIRLFNTAELTKVMISAIMNQQPPKVNGKKIRLKYAHPGGCQPLKIIIHGTKTEYIKNDYKKYLKNYFQNFLKISGAPISLHFKNNLKTNIYK